MTFTHRFDPTTLREYDIRGTVGGTLSESDAFAIGRCLELEEKHYDRAAQGFRSICEHHPEATVAPQACYWAAVSENKATHSSDPLKSAARLLRERYPRSEWTKKASVWAA